MSRFISRTHGNPSHDDLGIERNSVPRHFRAFTPFSEDVIAVVVPCAFQIRIVHVGRYALAPVVIGPRIPYWNDGTVPAQQRINRSPVLIRIPKKIPNPLSSVGTVIVAVNETQTTNNRAYPHTVMP